MKKIILVITLFLVSAKIGAVTLYTPNGKAFQTTDGNHASYNADYFAAWVANNLGPGNPYPNSEVILIRAINNLHFLL